MKRILILLIALTSVSSAFAGPSVIGGRPLSASTAHNIAAGWPSLSYEWWNAGKMDWALGAEMVYGDWSGGYSNVKIGLGLNVPLRWHMYGHHPFDVAFRFTPGVLVAEGETDQFVFGARGEMAVPVSIAVHPKVSLVTGVAAPIAVYFPRHGSVTFVLPVLPRIGVEVMADPRFTVWVLLEMGPAIGIADSKADVDLGVRGSFGVAF